MAEHSPRNRPLLIFDGDCAFCRGQVSRLERIIGNAIDYAPWQAVAARFPQISPEQFNAAMHFVAADGQITRGAAALVAALRYAPGRRWRLPGVIYHRLPGAAGLAEWLYRLIARHRHRLGGSASCPLPPPASRPDH